jgi:hypothetical protein
VAANSPSPEIRMIRSTRGNLIAKKIDNIVLIIEPRIICLKCALQFSFVCNQSQLVLPHHQVYIR